MGGVTPPLHLLIFLYNKHMPFFVLLTALLLSACQPKITVTDFDSCVAAKGVIQESYPPRCVAGNQTFTQNIGNELELQDQIILNQPRPNQTLTSPITLIGQARGPWFFEASFPVKLQDQNGQEIATAVATAQGEWMTEDFVPFTTTLTFPTQPPGSLGTLVLAKDNPSGDPALDQTLTLPIRF
jgi:hypothetical protein